MENIGFRDGGHARFHYWRLCKQKFKKPKQEHAYAMRRPRRARHPRIQNSNDFSKTTWHHTLSHTIRGLCQNYSCHNFVSLYAESLWKSGEYRFSLTAVQVTPSSTKPLSCAHVQSSSDNYVVSCSTATFSFRGVVLAAGLATLLVSSSFSPLQVSQTSLSEWAALWTYPLADQTLLERRKLCSPWVIEKSINRWVTVTTQIQRTPSTKNHDATHPLHTTHVSWHWRVLCAALTVCAKKERNDWTFPSTEPERVLVFSISPVARWRKGTSLYKASKEESSSALDRSSWIERSMPL